MLKDLNPPNLVDKKEGSISTGTISRVAEALRILNTKLTTTAPSDPSLHGNDHETPKETHFEDDEFAFRSHHFAIIAAISLPIVPLILFLVFKKKISRLLNKLKTREETSSPHPDDQEMKIDVLSACHTDVELGVEAAAMQSNI